MFTVKDRLRAGSLALAAVLAVGLALVTPALAEEFAFVGEVDEMSLNGTEEESTKHVFTTKAGSVECTEATYTGFLAEFVETEVEFTAHYGGCTAASGMALATIEMNGCTYRLIAGNLEGGNHEGTVDLVCPEEAEIAVKVTIMGSPLCTIHMPPQSGLGSVTFANVDKGSESEITVDLNIENQVQYSYEPGLCAPGSASDGSFTGKVLIAAEDPGEAAAALSVTGAPGHGELDPSPVVIEDLPNGDRTGFIYFTQPGEYLIWEQKLENLEKFKLSVNARSGRCAGNFKVPQDTRSCIFRVTGNGAAKGNFTTLITTWSEVGAKAPTPIKTRVERP